MSVKKHIDIINLVPNFEEQLVKNVTRRAQEVAQKIVRVDQGTLKNSIHVSDNVVYSDLPYARAQEYGLAEFGKPNYGFTPYMRPAAKDVESNIASLAKKSMSETIGKV